MAENNIVEEPSGGPNLVADLDKPNVLDELVKDLRTV